MPKVRDICSGLTNTPPSRILCHGGQTPSRIFLEVTLPIITKARNAIVGLIILLIVPVAYSQTNESARVLDGTGGWATNISYTTITAGSQPSPTGANTSSNHINFSGFLQSFLLHPTLDTDADSIPDENDPDNDNDGMDDGREALAGTDPMNAASLLQITGIQKTAQGFVITWESRGGYVYNLMAVTNLTVGLSNSVPLVSITAQGGIAPWYETNTTITNDPADPSLFFYIETSGPE